MRRTPMALAFVVVFCSNTLALVPGPSLDPYAPDADLVAVARPVMLRKVKVSDELTYELGTFELVRVIASSRDYLDAVRDSPVGRPRFCVLRVHDQPGLHWKKRDLKRGDSYLLVLRWLEVSGCYAPSNEYGEIPEATDERLRHIRKVIYGSEEEPLATGAMPVPKAIEYAAGVMEATAKSLREYARRSDKEIWNYLARFEFSPREIGKYKDYPFRHLADDRRVLLIKVEGDLELRTEYGRRGSVNGHPPYSPLLLNRDEGYAGCGAYVPEDSKPVAVAHGCRFHITSLVVNAFDFDRVLLAEREIDTARGKWKIKMCLKIDPRPVGVPRPKTPEPKPRAEVARDDRLVWEVKIGEECYSSPAVVGGRVFVGGSRLFCLDAKDGRKIWESGTDEQFFCSPAVSGGRVFCGSGDHSVYCLDATDGRKLWAFRTAWDVSSSPAVAGGRVFVGSGDDKLYCLSAKDGRKLWEAKVGGPVDSSPAVAAGRVFVGTGSGRSLCCYSAEDGREIWRFKTVGVVYSTPAVATGRVYTLSGDDRLYCLSEKDGRKLWEREIRAAGMMSSPAVAGGCVYVGTDGGELLCLNAESGEELWRFESGPMGLFSPAVAGGRVFVGSIDSRLYCLSAEGGKKVWDFDPGDEIPPSLAVAGGCAYVGTDGGKLLCLRAGVKGPRDWPMFRGDLARTGCVDLPKPRAARADE